MSYTKIVPDEPIAPRKRLLKIIGVLGPTLLGIFALNRALVDSVDNGPIGKQYQALTQHSTRNDPPKPESQPSITKPANYELYIQKTRPLVDELTRIQSLMIHWQSPQLDDFQRQMKEVNYQALRLEGTITDDDKQMESYKALSDALRNLNILDGHYSFLNRKRPDNRDPAEILEDLKAIDEVSSKTAPAAAGTAIVSLTEMQSLLRAGK